MEPMSVVSSVYDDESVQDYGEIVRDSNGLLRLGAHDLKLNVVLLRTSLVADGSDANQSIACQLGLHITVTDEERWRSSALAAPDITLLDVRLSCEPVTVSTRSTKPSRRWLCQPNESLAELVDCRRQSGLAIGSDWTRTNCDVRTLASKRATDWRSARGWIKTVTVSIPARPEVSCVRVTTSAWLSDDASDYVRGVVELDAAELRRRTHDTYEGML